jgi:hypothetical protein
MPRPDVATKNIGMDKIPSMDSVMKHSDFKIGEHFLCGGNRWRVTDVGTRVITAIMIAEGRDPGWYNGPPYAVVEDVFDENDVEGCEPIL